MSTHNIPLSVQKENIPNTIMTAAMGFLSGTQERVRSSRGKRVISVRATAVLLYLTEFTATDANF